MTTPEGRPPRPRLTRRGRTVAWATVVVAVGVALVALRGPSEVRGPGLTTGAAVVVPSPSPIPQPPPWRSAVPRPVEADLVVLEELADEASVVVVADLADRFDRELATWLAARLQAVVVAAPPSPTGEPTPAASPPATSAVVPDGLGADHVVAVGDVTVAGEVEVRRVRRSGPTPPAAADLRAGPLEVRRAVRVAGRTEPPVRADLGPVEDLLAEATAADPTGVVLLARPGGLGTDAVATALALGHHVVVTGAGDPRADPALGAALAGRDVRVALVGDGWEGVDLDDWAWKLAVARRGLELPGGGQVIFPDRMIVALYGNPHGPALGVLGEQPLEETLVRAAAQAAVYDGLVDVPVVPALEIIATVASGSAGRDGDYSTRTDIATIRPYVDAAREAGLFVVLDLQPGRTDFLSQAKEYEELLREPHVGLALDPEWRLRPDEVHLRRVGSVAAAEVNAVVGWLADLTRREALPQKLLVLHQFTRGMITERETIDTSRDELALVLHVDGQGGQPAKLATYANMLRDLPPGIAIGWKNFHDEDHPMRSEAETVALDPRPVLVTYQ